MAFFPLRAWVAFSLTVAVLGTSVSQAAAPALALGTPASLASTYRLGPADKIRVTVFNEPTLSGEFLINSDGSVALPLIGNIPAVQRSAVELQAAIEAKFAAGYLKEPRVVVEVLTYRPFYIYGQVVKPGEYPYSAGLTVLKAVAIAQGFTYRANQKRIYLKRNGEKSEAEAKVSADSPVQPGDTIRVAERHF